MTLRNVYVIKNAFLNLINFKSNIVESVINQTNNNKEEQ